MSLLADKRIESNNLKQVAKEFSRLFKTETYVDDQKFLGKYGIFIPEKKNLPRGYIKLWPQDFIVEEISLDGDLHNIYHEKFLSTKKEFSYEEQIIYATLVKCGLSTIEAVEELAKDLNTEPKNIKFAGIKDKHAITSQLISIKGPGAEKIYDLSAPYFFIKNVFSQKRELFLGGLRGNQFTILIRTEHHLPEKEFLTKLKELEKKGFYNFFYLQRFGVPRLTNPECGLHIIKGDYEKAVFTAFCKPGERELPYFQALRKSIAQLWGDWEEISDILDTFPLTFQDERKLIDYLIQNPKDFVGALHQIPRVVELWLTSFASLLFNKKLSFYLKEKQKLPPALPLILCPEKKTWLFYKDLLEEYGIFSMTFSLKNLAPLPFIRLRERKINTIEEVEVLNCKVIPEGVILNFNLPKGCYATTFLSHLFNLISGTTSRKISSLPIDTKANIKKPSLEEILNQFQEVVYLPSWKYSWRIY